MAGLRGTRDGMQTGLADGGGKVAWRCSCSWVRQLSCRSFWGSYRPQSYSATRRLAGQQAMAVTQAGSSRQATSCGKACQSAPPAPARGLSPPHLPENCARHLSSLGVCLDEATGGMHVGQALQAAVHVIQQLGGMPGHARLGNSISRGAFSGGGAATVRLAGSAGCRLLLSPRPAARLPGAGIAYALPFQAAGQLLHSNVPHARGDELPAPEAGQAPRIPRSCAGPAHLEYSQPRLQALQAVLERPTFTRGVGCKTSHS